MSRTPGRASRRLVPTLAVLATLTAGLLGAVPAQAAPDGSGPVIAELYVNGGSANAPFRNKFVELHNPTGAPIDLDGWSLQYRSPTGTGSFQAYALEGTIPAGGDFLVQGGSNASNGVPLTGVDDEIGINPGANGGVVALVNGTDAVTNAVTGDVASDPDWVAAGGVDLVGYGNANTFEGAAATNPAGTTDPKAMVRAGSTDTDVNSADLTLSATVTPCGATGCQGEEEPVDPTDATIAEIQGTTDVSPLAGQTVTTQGVVTAAFPTGGLDGVYLQTSGTGGAYDPDAAASHGIFVYSKAVATEAEVGQLVEVTGTVSEYFGLTQISPASSGFSVLEGPGRSSRRRWPSRCPSRTVRRSRACWSSSTATSRSPTTTTRTRSVRSVWPPAPSRSCSPPRSSRQGPRSTRPRSPRTRLSPSRSTTAPRPTSPAVPRTSTRPG